MKHEITNRKVRYTHMVLQNSLVELMQQKPISKITVTEICKHADINRTTFYAHYKDQYELLHIIEEQTLAWARAMLSRIQAGTEKNEALTMIEAIFQYFIDNKNHIQILMSEQGNIDFQKKIFALVYEQYCIPSPSLDPGEQAGMEYSFVYIINGSIGLIQHWLKNGLTQSAKEMAELLYNLTFQLYLPTSPYRNK